MEPALDKISRNVSPDDGNHTSKASRSARKRTRDAVKAEDLNDTFDLGDDGRPKTRRVNPQRLALRLGPDLVAEMEALIVPGAKMPNFTVRKDFQERYNVDRRHIYDYFHSRGTHADIYAYFLASDSFNRSSRLERGQAHQPHTWTSFEGGCGCGCGY